MASTNKIGFIGLGLIGGSIAKAIRKYYPGYEIIAFDKNRETLALAVQDGIIHTSCSGTDAPFLSRKRSVFYIPIPRIRMPAQIQAPRGITQSRPSLWAS